MRPNKPAAVLFDLDDTLIDCGIPEEDWAAAHRVIGPSFSEEAFIDAIRTFRAWYWDDPEGNRRGRLNMPAARREVAAGALARLGCGDADLAARLADECTARREARMRLYPESVAVLATLKAEGVRTAIITNGRSEEQHGKIARFGLAEYVDCILVEGDLGYGKPDRRIFELALGTLSVSASETWMIGDRLDWDVAGAQAAGIVGIWFNPSCFAPEGRFGQIIPDRTISTLGEVRTWREL